MGWGSGFPKSTWRSPMSASHLKEASSAATFETQNARINGAVAVIDDAIEQFNPQWVFALFSGGHDSLTSSYVASLHPKFSGCVHINTGIGIPATRQFVIDTCSEHGWALKEYKASENTKSDGTPDPKNYDDIVLKYGFPGAHGHSMMYRFLKERALARLCREHDTSCKWRAL